MRFISKFGECESGEGCLSLYGVFSKECLLTIRVKYQGSVLRICQQVFTGWTARIV